MSNPFADAGGDAGAGGSSEERPAEEEAKLHEAMAAAQAMAAATAAERAELIRHVLRLQSTIEETNQKISETQSENTALAAENETLKEYVDSLMETVRGMGGMITTDAKQASKRSLLGTRLRKAVQVNSHLGELSTSPNHKGDAPGSPSKRPSAMRRFSL
jgi:cell division protein FtsB